MDTWKDKLTETNRTRRYRLTRNFQFVDYFSHWKAEKIVDCTKTGKNMAWRSRTARAHPIFNICDLTLLKFFKTSDSKFITPIKPNLLHLITSLGYYEFWDVCYKFFSNVCITWKSIDILDINTSSLGVPPKIFINNW